MRTDIESSVKKIRWLTVVSFVSITTHCGLLLLGLRLPFAEILTVSFGFYLIYIVAVKVFKFCFLVKTMLFYDYVAFLCIWIERYQGFGRYLTPARLTMFSIGIVIYVFLIRQQFHIWKEKADLLHSKPAQESTN